MTREFKNILPHPLAELFPPTPVKQYLQLKADIEQNGLLSNIVTCEGKILDGRSRNRACVELGIQPRFCEYRGSDPLAFAISSNLHRRHLNESQRAVVAADTVRLRGTTIERQPQICGGLSQRAAARMFTVSLRSVEKASALIGAVEKGSAIPELLTAVRNGDRRLYPMEKLARATLAEQREAMASPLSRALGARRFDARQWDRDSDQIALRTIRPIRLALGMAMEADQAGELTAQRWGKLFDSCKRALEVLTMTIKEIEGLRLPFKQE
jgi:hypothetical protein